jgi:hypothetical protein
LNRSFQPVAPPKLLFRRPKAEGDWIFDVEIALKPIVKLGIYAEAIKTEFASKPKSGLLAKTGGNQSKGANP